jgi:hypothetical protein
MTWGYIPTNKMRELSASKPGGQMPITEINEGTSMRRHINEAGATRTPSHRLEFPRRLCRPQP